MEEYGAKTENNPPVDDLSHFNYSFNENQFDTLS